MNTQSTYAPQFEVLKHLESAVGALMEQHINHRVLWYSSDFLPASGQNKEEGMCLLKELQEKAESLPPSVRVSLELNLLTEEGLPHFHRIIGTVAAPESNLGKWNNLWTAEEDRHGGAIRDYARDSRIFNFRAVEEKQFAYINSGFNPTWVGKSPYEIFVYTSLQELATQRSHDRTGKIAGNYEPTLQKILEKIAQDEARHYAFYLNLFKEILKADTNNGLTAAAVIMPHIDMPGISMPKFKEHMEIVAKLGIYTLRDYKKIVEGIIQAWKITAMNNLNALGAEAQETILNLPKKLERVAERIELSLKKLKTFTFESIYEKEFVL